MRKMDATFYCHFAIPVSKQEWWRGESGGSRMNVATILRMPSSFYPMQNSLCLWPNPTHHISHVLLRVGRALRPQLDRGGDQLLLAEGRSVEGVTLGLELRRVPGTLFIDVVGSLATCRSDMECNCDNFLKNLVVEMKRDLIHYGASTHM